MKRVVCDTNVLVSGLLWKGAPRHVLSQVENGKIALFTSRDLLDEMERVLSYPRVARIFENSGMTKRDILCWVVEYSTIMLPRPLPSMIVSADPSDDNVLACAVAADADVIVSGDKHVLALEEFDGIPIMRPAMFLKRIGR